MNVSRLYAFDIDGTILTSDHRILPSTKEGIELLKERSGIILLASARPPRAIDPITSELGLDPFYVSLNGALVIHGEEILFEEPMNATVTQAVIARGLAKGLSVNVYTAWDWLIKEPNHWSTVEGNVVGYQGKVADLSMVTKAHKLLLIGEVDEVLELQAELQKEVPEVSATRSFSHYLEVVSQHASKAKALSIVSERLGVRHKNVIAFGDGENDLPMLKIAGYAVAMANAHPSLKNMADFVTASNDEDGIWQAIQAVLALED